jgi:hypothetical protein
MGHGKHVSGTSYEQPTPPPLFFEDFEGLNLGPLDGQNAWIDNQNKFAVANLYPYSGAKHLRVNTNVNCYARRYVTPTSSGKLSFCIRRDESTSGVSLGLVANNTSEHHEICHAGISSLSLIYKSDGNGGVLQTTIALHTWYCIECEWRAGPPIECRYRISGKSWTAWVPPSEPCGDPFSTNIEAQLLRTGTNLKDFSYDYILETL